MHVHFLDPYLERRSLVHLLDARIKFILSVAFILTTALVPEGSWGAYLILLSIVLAAAILSELGPVFVLKRALLALPFVLAALPVIFTLAGSPLFSLSLGSWTLTASQPGLVRFISIALKSWISVQMAIILSASTPFPELLAAMRAVGMPRLLVAVFGLMWRYLFVLVDEVLRLIRARAARSGESPIPGRRSGGSLVWRARVAGGMAGNLFLRAIERSERIYMAMLSRGYDGEVRSFSQPALRPVDRLVLIAGLAIFALILLFGFLF